MEEERRSRTLATETYEQLRRDIISGEFSFGQKLPVRTICERYGVGLTPARDALNRASYEELIVHMDQRGFTVAPLNEEDMDDLLFIRCSFNELALRRSTKIGGSAWEEEVLIAYHRLTRQPFDRNAISDEWEEAHRIFHMSLLTGCGSDRLIRYCEHLSDAWNRYRFLSRSVIGPEEGPSGDHRLMMEAAINRDADEAVRILTAHFNKTADLGRLALARLADRQPTGNQKQMATG
jgi:GntR family transcriptional regulator, carbon starvation induced regulator